MTSNPARKRKKPDATTPRRQEDGWSTRFGEAIQQAAAQPTDESPWEALEEAAVAEQRPDGLLELYRRHLSDAGAGAMMEIISRRAVRFAADCYGENAPQVTDLLGQVLRVAPQAEWAFSHLVAALTMNARWAELLDAHDARLAVISEAAPRKALLDEAAHIAKDLAGDAPRASGYLSELFHLDPADTRIATALERLLERHERWDDLVALWRQRLPVLPGTQARDLGLRAAIVLHEKLGRPDAALEQARALLAGDRGGGSAGQSSGIGRSEEQASPLWALLERLLDDPRAGAATRLGALSELRIELETAGVAERLPRLLKVAIAFAEGEDLPALRRECAERLHALGDGAGALEQVAALLQLLPEDREVEHRLRTLAEEAADPACLARALGAASAVCRSEDRKVELLIGAAKVHDRQLDQGVDAAARLEEALGHASMPSEVRLSTLRRLEELYGALGADGQRLETLERLAAAEPRPGEQRLMWARLGELAAKLGQIDRALAAWDAQLTRNPEDAEALAAQARILAQAERWEALVAVLRRRIATAPAEHQIRADLVQIAKVARDRLANTNLAIEAWREVIERFGEDGENVLALADLLAAANCFEELGELLSRRAVTDRASYAGMLARLGDTFSQKLGDPGQAFDWYRRALDVDPSLEVARAGLTALLDRGGLASRAAEALASAAEKSGPWSLLLDLLPYRLSGARSPTQKARLLEEAAALALEHDDPRQAYGWLCQALPLVPGQLRLLTEVMRLGESTGDFAHAAQALGEAAAAPDLPPVLKVRLLEEQARLLEERLSQPALAADSYAAALTLAPERLELRLGLVRTAGLVGRWTEAAAAVVDAIVSPQSREQTVLPLYEAAATAADAQVPATSALGDAVRKAAGLLPTVRRDLFGRVARLFIDRCADSQAADAVLGEALVLDPGHLPTLLLRVELERPRPDRLLFDTLTQVGQQIPNDLDHPQEAVELALSSLGDPALAQQALSRLWDQAVRLHRQGIAVAGKRQAPDVAVFALDRLVQLSLDSGKAENMRQAVALLGEGARLPFAEEIRRGWLRRAAEISETRLGDRTGAIAWWRSLHEEVPTDPDPREALARLFEADKRFAEAVSLRVAELEGCADPDRRLDLRLEIVRLCGLLEDKTSAPEVLRANLDQQPGHRPSLEKLSEVLTRKGAFAELAGVLQTQAHLLQERSEGERAAELWADLARLAEKAMGDPDLAVAGWQRVADLAPTFEALDALGRLNLAAGDAGGAAAWLERRLGMTEGEARIEVTARLAEAYLQQGQRHRAIAWLDRTLGELPAAESLRDRLEGLYREDEAWEPLARVLAEGCEYLADPAHWTARAQSAVDLYAQLGQLSRAVPLLEKLVRQQPDDEAIRSALAEGLFQCQRFDEARTILLALIEQAGWRRSRKRASLHQRLGRVAQAQADFPFALEHLELAASMDVSNRDILERLAEVAEAAGADARAEAAYRALLVLGRKNTPGPGPGEDGPSTKAGLSVTGILLRLHDLAHKQSEEGKAAELLESALTTAVGDPEEARRLQRVLAERGNDEVLAQLFDKRLAQAGDSPEAADIHAERAESLRVQGRLDLALEAQLRAVKAAPERAPLRQAAVNLAVEAGRAAELIDRLVDLTAGLRRRLDAPVAAALLLEAAHLAELPLADTERAAELCRRAEETQARPVEVWGTLARLAHKRGDRAERSRMLSLLRQRAAETHDAEASADALFRAAAVELLDPETRGAGIAGLGEALDKNHDVERARKLVVDADLAPADLVQILPLYERFARQSGDPATLLDYLARRAATDSVSVAEVREAVDLAVALEQPQRAVELLERMVEVAAAQPDGDKQAAWALLELLQRQKAAGDLEAAAHTLERAADKLEPSRIRALAHELADRAASIGQRRLGARLLERLRVASPADEKLWRSLLERYNELDDRAGIDRLVDETLPLLVEPAKRNELRLYRVRFLLARDARDPAAIEALRDVLLDEPRNGEAVALLAAHYQASGAEEDLVDLLEQSFSLAVEAGDQDAVVETALGLGDVLARTDVARATDLYQRALQVAPGRRELSRRLLALTAPDDMTRDKAELMEELLAADAGAEAARLAQELADVWARLGDETAVCRVLEKGCVLVPDDQGLRGRLETWYRSHDAWAPLARLLAAEAERHPDPGEAAALMCEAAALLSGKLNDDEAGLTLLEKAREQAPENLEVLSALARTLVASGDTLAAVAELQNALEKPTFSGSQRVSLLLLRAEIDNLRRDRRAAAEALDEAYAVSPEEAFEPLSTTLSAWREQASRGQEIEDLREATLRLANLLRQHGDAGRARGLLHELMEAKLADEAIVDLAGALAEAEGDMEGALASATARMSLAADEQAQEAAGARITELSARLGRPQEAIAPLEAALAQHPGSPGLSALLLKLYERSGQTRKLAMLLFEQASRQEEENQRFRLLSDAGARFIEVGEGSIAVMALTEALAARPDDQEATLLLADAYVLAGALQEAAELIQPLITAHKGKPSPVLANLYLRLSNVAARAQDTSAELDALWRAVEADRKNGLVAARLADRAEAAGDDELAIKALRSIIAHQAAGPLSVSTALLRQARLALRRGDKDRAILFARRAAQEAHGEELVLAESRAFLESLGVG